MRLCRYQHAGSHHAGFYFESGVVDLVRLAAKLGGPSPETTAVNLLDYLPHGRHGLATAKLYDGYQRMPAADQAGMRHALDQIQLRTPIPAPSKVILLAGNYAEHVKEAGGQASERSDTFPYFFWKPPLTTLTHPGDPIRIPKVSPDHVDWEVELGVVIGKRCHAVTETDALQYVAGYTVCNDVSDRKFKINPARKPREKDKFFDWLHGKWHDTFLPMGPCVLAASAMPDPQQFALKLRVNGKTMQDASTSQMVFPVAALVSILSSFVTLEPGDVISTGTPAGVGFARNPPVYLKPGDAMEAEIESIGILRNPVV